MDKDRRKQAIKVKVQRLSDSISRARKDREGPVSIRKASGPTFCPNLNFSCLIVGVERLMRTYSGNPSFSNQKNLEETEQQLDEVKGTAAAGGRGQEDT